MFRTISRNAPGHNFTAFRDEFPHGVRIFVINFQIGICAEPTELSAVKEFFLPPLGFSISNISHAFSSVMGDKINVSKVVLSG